MNKKELENEITKTHEQLKALQKKLKEIENEVPETLDFKFGDNLFVTDIEGSIRDFKYDGTEWDIRMSKRHRAFLSEEYAKMFAKKTQFIADMLHFKYLYDRDYEPNWDSDVEQKYCVYYNAKTKRFEWTFRSTYAIFESVYFSTPELARKCVDWLNKKVQLIDVWRI